MSRLIATIVGLGVLGMGGVAILDTQREAVADTTTTTAQNQSLTLVDGISQSGLELAVPGAILLLGAVLVGVALLSLGGAR